MEHKPVKSTVIETVGYDPNTKTLGVRFRGGTTYHYHGVEPEKHRSMMEAPSPNGFLRAHIIGKHHHSKT